MGFLLTSLGFPGPITLSLSLGFMSLPWTPYSLSLHCLGPAATLSHFSNSYFAHGMLFLSFLASLSLLAFSRPMYTFVGPVTHYSYRLGLMGFFAIYPVNSLWPSLLGPSVCWASTNGPQQPFFTYFLEKHIKENVEPNVIVTSTLMISPHLMLATLNDE